MRLVAALASLLLVVGALRAQDIKPISDGLDGLYEYSKALVLEMASRMPEESYDFKAVPEVRTFGQLVGHVADHQAYTCGLALGEVIDLEAENKATKLELIAALEESFAICDSAHEAFTDANATEMLQAERGKSSRFELLVWDISHSMEAYGYMAVYLRLKGIVPPSTDPEFWKERREARERQEAASSGSP